MAKKPTNKKKPAGKPLAQRLAASPALVEKYRKDPGLRSKYLKGSLEKYLTPAQKKTRAVNVRLSAPIAPGSSTTERDLAHEAQAATTVRYGPQDRAIAQQLGVAQQTQQDTGTFYDQYRAALQQHAAQVQAYQAGAQQALQQTAAGITGLGSQEALQMQTQANQAAAQQGIAPAGDLSQLANAAMATRQGVMGSFQGQQALTGAATNTYADTQANVVAPGQKLSALAQAAGRTRDVRQKQADLATEKGAYNQQFRQERRQDEFKNQLAVQTLGANVAQDQAQTQVATQRIKSQETQTKARLTSQERQTKARLEEQSRQGKLNRQNQRELARLRAKQKAADEKAKATTSKEEFRTKYGVDLQPTSAHNRVRDAVQNAQTAFGQVGKTVKQADGKPHKVTTDDVVSHLRDQGVSNLWIRAGLEMARGGLTPGTANRIHKAGYSVATLGYKMRPASSRPTGGIPAGKI